MRLAAWMVALFSACAALGQTGEKPIQMDDLVAEALKRNPEILAAQKKYEATRQRPAQERALPDPMVSFGWNSSGNPLPGAGLGKEPTANIGFMASQELPYPGKLRLRAEVAGKEAEAAAEEFRAVELSVISRVKQAVYRLHHTHVEREILARNRELMRSLLRVTEARYSVGKAAQPDIFRMQTQLTVLEARELQLDGERREREDEIRNLLAWPPMAAVALANEMDMAEIPFAVDDLIAKARETAPALRRDQKMVERAGTALNLARKSFYPDVTLNAGYYNMGSMPAMYMFRADVKIPIRFGKQRAELTEQSQKISEARHTYEATENSLEYRIRQEYRTAETSAKLMRLYSETMMPQAKLAVESSRNAYANGSSDFMSVLSNHVAALEYEMNYHEQMEMFHIALVRLEEMTGVRLIP